MLWEEFVNLLHKAVDTGFRQLQQNGNEREEQSRVVKTHEESSATRQIDLTIQEAVLATLKNPLIEIISEEGTEEQKNSPEFFVVLDPIDGTTNFDHGLPFYAISLAAGRVTDNRKMLCDIEIGIISTVSGDWFVAQKNKGATLNGSAIRTSQVSKLNKAIIRPTSEFTKKTTILDRKFDSFLYLGSTAVELAFLAMGAIDIFVETKRRKVFDFAAAYLIAHEAGAVISDLQGNNLDNEYINKRTKSTLIIAANEKLHRSVLNIYK